MNFEIIGHGLWRLTPPTLAVERKWMLTQIIPTAVLYGMSLAVTEGIFLEQVRQESVQPQVLVLGFPCPNSTWMVDMGSKEQPFVQNIVLKRPTLHVPAIYLYD